MKDVVANSHAKTVTLTKNGEVVWSGRYDQLAEKVTDPFAFALVVRARDAKAIVNDTDADKNNWSATVE